MGSGSPRFSVVVPTRNRASLLTESALRSVLRQSFEDFEVVVVDNASADDTGAAVRALHDSRLRYVRAERWIPKEDFFQFALDQAAGEYCTLFFDDDALIVRALELADVSLRSQPADILSYSRACVYHFPNWHESTRRNVLTVPPYTAKLFAVPSHQHLREVYARMDLLLATPMVSNAFYRTAFLRRVIQDRPRLFPHGHMGDYNIAAWTLWSTAQDFLYLDYPLAVFGHWKENTSAQLHDLQTTMPEYQEWIAWMMKAFLAKMPLQTYTWMNAVAAALLDMQQPLQLPFGVDPTTYLGEFLRELDRLVDVVRVVDVAAGVVPAAGVGLLRGHSLARAFGELAVAILARR